MSTPDSDGDLAGTYFQDFADADPRPTFVVDLRNKGKGVNAQICYENSALQDQGHLLDDILSGAQASTGLKAWVLEASQTASAEKWHDNVHWYAYNVKDRWRIVQCLWCPQRGFHARSENETLDRTRKGDAATPEEDPDEREEVLSLIDQATDAMSLTLLKEELGRQYDREKQLLHEVLAKRTVETSSMNKEIDRMLRMLDMVDVGIFEYNPQGKLVQANDAFYNLTGHPRETSRQETSWADCIFDEDRDWLFGQWALMASGTALTFEMKWKRPATFMADGLEDVKGQWVLAACVPILDEEGTVTSVSGCLTDIQAQKQSEVDAIKRAEALERATASEQRFFKFAKSANVAIWILDLNRKMQYCNHEWFSVTGHPVVPFENVDWSSVVSEDGLASIDRHWDGLVANRQSARFQFSLRRTWSREDGVSGPAFVLVSAYPELREDGSVRAIAGTLTDVSHLKWAESVQKMRTDEAVEAKRQQDFFTDMTSHEIRNPLGAVVHCAELLYSSLEELEPVLRASPLPPDARRNTMDVLKGSFEAVDTIISCSNHQKRIVDDILTLSKLDSSLLKIAPSLIQIDTILQELQKMFEVDAQKVGVKFETEKEESLNILKTGWVTLDPGRLMQVLINLLTNAIKFTQRESVRHVTVSMGASSTRPSDQNSPMPYVSTNKIRDVVQPDDLWGNGEPTYLRFTVQDTGCGLNDEQKARIFARFSQASPRTHTKYGGSGLGLFISRELTEMQGGQIGVSSDPGAGAKFAFYIKARQANPRRKSVSAQSTSNVAHSNTDSPNLSILIVEDNLVNQAVLQKQLKKQGYGVHIANHGKEALQCLRSTKRWKGNEKSASDVDVVLMDIEMPIMDGYEATRKVREHERQGDLIGHVPIIAVSANARSEQVSRAVACGMDDAISKPFRISELTTKIERLLR